MSFHWPPDYVKLFAWRQKQLQAMRADKSLLFGAKHYYRTHPVEFICDWVDTYDPRNAGKPGLLTRMPFILFKRQREITQFLYELLKGDASGLIEKCRDAGATWVCVAFSVWLWLFWPGVAIGWGSRKEQLVDKLGVMDSIFEKIRAVIRGLPPEFLPLGFAPSVHMSYMRIVNPETDAVIIGEVGDNIGRGGRTRIYFKDESAWYERPELIEAALGDNTRVQVDISSVHGVGNVFHRKRESGVDWEPGQPVTKEKTNVFVFDWTHHPEKTIEWYNARRAKWIEEGLKAQFAQEVDRDYSASMEGVIIQTEWIRAAVDAHVKLEFGDDGDWLAGLDVADGGMDKSALAQRKGVVLRAAQAWGDEDVGKTTRKAIGLLVAPSRTRVMYDCIGVGAGVKSEANRLSEAQAMPPGLTFHPWNAGDAVLFKDKHIIRGDNNSPTNEEYYLNLRAQAWWELRMRFYRTFRAVTEGEEHNTEDLISIDSSIECLPQIIKELSQATSSLSTGRLKLMVDKTPEGTRSPNLADAIVMAYWPVRKSLYTLGNIG